MSEQGRKKRRRTRIYGLIIAAVLIVGGGLAYFLLTHESPEETNTAEPEMQTATVRQGDLSLEAIGAGTLTAGDEVTTGFETDGTLSEVYVEKGDSVEAGDLIAQLDSSDAEDNLADAEQNLADMTSTLAIAEQKVEIAALEETL
ncbi:MAG: biotin/lipoyl-binding protein, partial [Anaerolineaceae bacterium]|nr:biotin/lipoyl-binding protein [Anaerolineaceae bacterium]